MSRAAHAPLRPQVVHQLSYRYSPLLNGQAAVNRLVRRPHVLIIRMLSLQPSGNPFGRPVQHKFTRNDVPLLPVHVQKAALRSQRRDPSLAIRLKSAISRPPSMANDFPAHRRRSSTQTSGDLTDRRTRGDPSQNVLPASEGECSSRERRRAMGGMPPRGSNTLRIE
jgi:hypothetical protein